MSGSLVDGSEKEEAETVTNKLACLPLYISSLSLALFSFLEKKMDNSPFNVYLPLSFLCFTFTKWEMSTLISLSLFYFLLLKNGK